MGVRPTPASRRFSSVVSKLAVSMRCHCVARSSWNAGPPSRSGTMPPPTRSFSQPVIARAAAFTKGRTVRRRQWRGRFLFAPPEGLHVMPPRVIRRPRSANTRVIVVGDVAVRLGERDGRQAGRAGGPRPCQRRCVGLRPRADPLVDLGSYSLARSPAELRPLHPTIMVASRLSIFIKLFRFSTDLRRQFPAR